MFRLLVESSFYLIKLMALLSMAIGVSNAQGISAEYDFSFVDGYGSSTDKQLNDVPLLPGKVSLLSRQSLLLQGDFRDISFRFTLFQERSESEERDIHLKINELYWDISYFVFQHFNLIPVLTAFENVEYPLILNGYSAAERKKRVKDVLDKIGLRDHADRRPDQLSGGQQQRVAIARAMVHSPILVIADEPTANLDTETANQVIDLMQRLGKEMDTTFLIATHDQRMTTRCDRIVTLQDGVIVEALDQHVSNAGKVTENNSGARQVCSGGVR